MTGVPVGFLLVGLFGYGSPIAKAGAATPDWTAFVANYGSNTVTPIDTATGTTGTPIAVGSEPESDCDHTEREDRIRCEWELRHGHPDHHPNKRARATHIGGLLSRGHRYNAGRQDGLRDQRLVEYRHSDQHPDEHYATLHSGGFGPCGHCHSPSGHTAYVADFGSNSVVPIDLATRVVGAPIPVGNIPEQIAVSPDGATVYVVNVLSNNVTPIDVATNTAGTPIEVGSHAADIAITPNGPLRM